MMTRNRAVYGISLAISAVVLGLGGGSCGPSKSGGGNVNDAGAVCVEDEECAAGQLCIGNVCQYPQDASIDTGILLPDISVAPSALDFGFAPLRVDAILPLTVTNSGEADLEITAIIVEEVDLLPEFHATPEGVQDPPLVVAPGDSITIEVTLRPEDGELDEGQLRINSNDPDEPMVVVPLTSGYKGNPDLEACVLDADVAAPEPFTDCSVAEVTQEPIIDFGLVSFQQDASRIAVVRNVADGNAPLAIDDIYVSNDTGLGSHYAIEIFWLEEGPGGDSTEIPVTLPVYLRAFDPLLTIEEDQLHVRIWFDADLDGFLPAEHLIYTSNDADGQLAIPIFGVVSGCPVGTWDLNDDPNDGCEYACDYDGPEVCDGQDNNCDGDVDEEDALGCTVYYLDVDSDTYGVTTDSRCLCAPDAATHHTATVDGDCNDALLTVNPGMVEQCSTTDDDNCNADTNDQNAAGCTIFYLDGDQDAYGVTGDTGCFCVASGQYSALQGGDCDDANLAANPGAAEDCSTAFDDDCDGDTNNDDAIGCVDYFVDLDGDTYGQTSLSRCLCMADGSYSAINPGDCNDNSAAVHPAALENCSTGFDDNCDMDVNELGALNCTDYYLDVDGDNTGVTGVSECRCAPLGNYRALLDGDCNDANPLVSPLSVESCSTPYDDDCDGDTNDLAASGCTTYYLDADQDSFGLVGSTECRCQGTGSYTALVSGDCNDGDGTINPGVQENCTTAYDDNCDSDTNSLNAMGCTSYFFDIDNDGYGLAASVECRCSPNGFHRAPLPGDCNDSNIAINPGVAEVCDYIDNNCMGGVDEGFNLLTDVTNCGACNNVCTNAHGTTACAGGQCTPICVVGFGDCDADVNNGCETDLSTVSTCGTCILDTDCPGGFFCQVGICTDKLPDGDPCSGDSNCESDHCVDNVCCDTACDSTCEACDLSGSEGTCSSHAVGLDPENECTATAQSSCGLNGLCDGAGACDLWAASTECVAPSCTGSTRYNADSCDGSGACTDGGTVDCTPYVCSGDVCRTNCTDGTHCAAGNYCNASNVCVSVGGNGTACTNPSQCSSGNCVDGFCCNTPCAGTCQTCSLTGVEGTCSNRPSGSDPEGECGLCRVCNGVGVCTNVSDGSDPKNDCTAQSQASCGYDGECNGSAGCRYWAASTECLAQTCTGNIKSLADVCSGAGACTDGGTVDCSPYLCLGDDCRTTCTLSTQCVGGSFCSGGSCTGQKGLGQACGGDAECLSGSCADGVCCNGACAGTCLSCNLAGNVGNCTSIPANQDPDGECGGTCMSCNGGGACASTAAGVDPESDCAQTAQSTCGDDGECNGSGGCRQWVISTECVAQTCVGSTRYLADLCNGTGTCTDNGSVPCAPYICNATGTDCHSDCSLDTDCTAGNYCNAGLCSAKKANGQTCSTGNECSSTNCVDGYCCNATCVGACRSCAISGSEGTCANHAVNSDPEGGCGVCSVCDGAGTCANASDGSDPKNECSADAQASCGQDGDCDGAGACGRWPSGTECAASYCADDTTQAVADSCNGSGLCTDNGTVDCTPYKCLGTACRVDCTLDTHCVTGAYCSGGVCVGQKALGVACGAGNECASTFCADGVCCDATCATACVACNQAGNLGSCSPYTSGTDPETECASCQVCNGSGACAPAAGGTDPKGDCAASGPDTCGFDGDCNGTGACGDWVFGTECVAQTCVDYTLNTADACNGVGVCVDSGSSSCAPYSCSGDSCRTDCTLQTDCAPGNYCTGSATCVAKKLNGQSCTLATECDSSVCTDGVCCNQTCGGDCQACNIAGAVGTCTNHPSNTDPETDCLLCQVCNGSGTCVTAADGTDPKDECAPDAQSTCNQDGDCNGSGACGAWAAGTECVAQSCSAHIQYNADSCNGGGTCNDGGSVDCSPYECEGDSCRTNCTGDVHCVVGYYCSGGACVVKKTSGSICSVGTECQSGACADGVCCNTSCVGDCRACNIAGSVGTCTNYTTGTDPEGNCGLCQVCNGTGTCINAGTGTDPKSECSTDAQSSCDQDGFCDGAGACDLYASGTECAAAVCVGNTLQNPDICNGTGTCSDGGNADCTPYICDGGGTSCRASCTLDGHCVMGFHCSGAVCVPDAPAGTTCVLDSECASTFCRDGYCCNNGCSDACRACDLPGLEGTCTMHAATTDPELECGTCRVCNGGGACIDALDGSDPKNECPLDAQSTCQYDGACNGGGSCGYYPMGTVCLAQTCSGSVRYLSDTCNGGGVCTDAGSQSCSPYLCDGNDCGSSCSVEGDCVAGYYCSAASTCLAKKSDGNSCGADPECVNGNCVDGYCCNSTCTGACRSCGIAGSLGVCSNFTNNTDPELECGLCQVCNGSGACTNAADNTDPKNECAWSSPNTCGFDGECNGAANCRYWSATTECNAQSCVGSTLYYADDCNGVGSCTDSGTTSCAPYVCSGTSCLSACTINAQCVAGYECKSGQCRTKVTLVYEDFSTCPAWYVEDGGEGTETWHCDTDESEHVNETASPSGGGYVLVDSDAADMYEWLIEGLITPVMNLSGYVEVTISYWHYFYHLTSDYGEFQYSTNGTAGPWTTLRTYNSDIFGVSEVVDVTAQVAGQTNVAFRWRYDDWDEWAWYWQVDDVLIEAY